jgi:serine/threonine-protein kinase
MIGNYKILKVIGQGGFGTTYLAEHDLIKKPAVIKQSNFKSDLAQEIILNEASLLWDVNHWALPTVKDVLTSADGDVLMVMSFIAGDELFDYVKTHGPVDAETACWIAQRILSALYYLHFQGIVHRDVKPANIIVNFDTHIATLVDFGLSKLKPDGTPDPSGYTPFFGAPEQIDGKAPIPESDIYSLGMTMIYMLGGDIRSKTVPDSVPWQLKDFIHAMIREDPLKRPKSCKELNEELGEIRNKLFKRKHSL